MNENGPPGRIRRTSEELRESARAMRKELTAAERILWEAIRDRQLGGLKFRRQHAVGRFVLDFYCAERRLVLEVDGPVHDTQEERDQERTAALEARGCRVLRFRNEEVESDLPRVLLQIRQAADG